MINELSMQDQFQDEWHFRHKQISELRLALPVWGTSPKMRLKSRFEIDSFQKFDEIFIQRSVKFDNGK